MKLSTGKRFSRLGLALAVCLGAGSASVQAHDELNGRPHHIDTPANPTAVMRAFSEGKLGDTSTVQNLTAMAAMPCTDGLAGGLYECDNIDLLAFIPLNEIGSTQSNDEANDIWGWTDSTTEKEYALIGRVFGTSFVDISDPVNPVYLGELRTHGPFGSPWRDIKVYDDHAFIVSEARRHGMQVFDLTELRNPPPADGLYAETAHYDGFGSAHNIVINEASGFAYGVGTDKCSGGLEMVNIQDPVNPTDAGCYAADGYTHDAQCVLYNGLDSAYVGNEICFASNEDTLTIVDVTDKANPQELSRTGYPGVGYTHQGWLTEDHVYFLLDDELDEQQNGHNTRTRIWDVSNLQAPLLQIATYDGPTKAIDHNLYTRGPCAFEANYQAGLRVIDFDPTDPANSMDQIGFFDIYPEGNAALFNGAWSNYPYFPSGRVVVSGIEQGLFILEPGSSIATTCVASAPPPPPPPTDTAMHIGDLGSATTTDRGGKWNATVVIPVHQLDAAGIENGVVAGATVSGTWSNGARGSGSCVTGGTGSCSVEKTKISRRSSSATFTVDNVTANGFVYQPADNHDGNSITLSSPN